MDDLQITTPFGVKSHSQTAHKQINFSNDHTRMIEYTNRPGHRRTANTIRVAQNIQAMHPIKSKKLKF